MSAMAAEKVEKLIYFPTFPKEVIPAKPRGRAKNYDTERKEACNGLVQPIKSEEDVRRIAEYFWDKKQYRNWCLFNAGINTGFRASDLLRIKVSDVAKIDENGKLYVPIPDEEHGKLTYLRMKEKKTGKYREVVISTELCKVFDTYIKKAHLRYDDWMFPSKKSSSSKSLRSNGGESIGETGLEYSYDANPKSAGEPLDVDSFGQIMRKVQKDLNLPYRLGTHSCRKTFGYNYIMKHRNDIESLAWLQKSFNHSSQAITLHYIGLDAEMDERIYSSIGYGVNTHTESDS